MLSYMLPAVEDKSSSSPRNLSLNLNLNGNGIPTTNGNGNNPTTNGDHSSQRLINFESTRPSALKTAIPVASSAIRTNRGSHIVMSQNNHHHPANASSSTSSSSCSSSVVTRGAAGSTADSSASSHDARSNIITTHASNLHQATQPAAVQPPSSLGNLDNCSSATATTTTNSILLTNEAQKAKHGAKVGGVGGNAKNVTLKR